MFVQLTKQEIVTKCVNTISLLSNFAKVFRIALFNHIYTFISSDQHDFVKRRPTITKFIFSFNLRQIHSLMLFKQFQQGLR